ncbi:MAG TPA: DUF2935 domain-containing protein [Bacillota bacterium]
MHSTNLQPESELKFWLQIMGDHSRFIRDSLLPGQVDLLLVAANFIQIFDRLLERARAVSGGREPGSLVGDATAATLSLRDFKRELLSTRLQNLPVTTLPPTFFNHMLNELEDFLKILAVIEGGRPEQESILGQHLLWSSDAAAHAAIIGSNLDKVESAYRERSRLFETRFDQLYIKTVEITGYFRSMPPAAQPALESLSEEITIGIVELMGFLEDIGNRVIQKKLLGRISVLQPDHMWREECYYLHQIARATPGMVKPECDPARPRVTG